MGKLNKEQTEYFTSEDPSKPDIERGRLLFSLLDSELYRNLRDGNECVLIEVNQKVFDDMRYTIAECTHKMLYPEDGECPIIMPIPNPILYGAADIKINSMHPEVIFRLSFSNLEVKTVVFQRF